MTSRAARKEKKLVQISPSKKRRRSNEKKVNAGGTEVRGRRRQTLEEIHHLYIRETPSISKEGAREKGELEEKENVNTLGGFRGKGTSPSPRRSKEG